MRALAPVALCALVGLAPMAGAQDSSLIARLNQIVSSYTPNNAFMGAVLVVEGDRILLDRGYGSADLEWSIPNAPDVEFRLGSVTKQFTATLILLLQQDGKLSLNDPVSKYLADAPKAWEKITIAELLGHTSGIANFTSFKEFRTWRMTPHSVEEELAFFRDKPLEFEPGTRFDYSNSNYEVLGAVIEKVSGRKYTELLRERILDPLKMTHSGLDTDELLLPKRAQGYEPRNGGLIPARSESMSVPWAAGSMYSTTGDLLKWEHGLFGGKVLSANSLKAMTTPGKGDYGLGVEIHNLGGNRVITHGGSIEGFSGYLAYVPDRRIAVIVLGNVLGPTPDPMSRQLVDAILGRPVTLASERKAVPISKEDLARFAGVYDLGPTLSLTIAVAGDALTSQVNGQLADHLMYQGVQDGHPRFYIPSLNFEIEFVPTADGSIASLIAHKNWGDMQGKRH
jgi:CubicO group peptidase (beta-lactamase class C family)